MSNAPVSTCWLMIAQAESPAGLDWQLRWNWAWPLWATVVGLLVVVVYVVTIYLRETSSAGNRARLALSLIRVTVLVLVVLMIAQPTVEWFRWGRPRLVLLVDRSASMDTLDRYLSSNEDLSRLDAWKNLLTTGDQPLIDQWQTDYQLEVVAFDESMETLGGNSGSLTEQLRSLTVDKQASKRTRLGDAIDYALRELPGPPPVAIVVLTDGISTLGQSLDEAADRARRMRVPLHTVAVGSERQRSDIAVENLLAEEIVFPGDRLQVEAAVRATGFAGQQVDAVLRGEDGVDLARTRIELPADGSTKTVTMAVRPDQAGAMTLELGIEPLEEEFDTDNNFVQQVVDVRDEKIDVLLVQSQPSYEFRALKSMLERDPAVRLRVVLQEADADYATVDGVALRAFPIVERELFSYDVVILGDVDLGLLPRSVWPLVERFVSEHGGGLVAIAGPNFMPTAYRGVRAMELLLPLELKSLNPLRAQIAGTESLAVYPTALGWQSPSLQLGDTAEESLRVWQSLPAVNWLLRLDDIKPGAQVLAEHPGLSNRQGQRLPVILRQYVGAGEVLFHATDETWRWRYRTDDRYFARYWGQVVRRLGRGRLAAGTQGIKLLADRSVYQPGDSVQLQVRFRNPSQAPAEEDGVTVQWQGPTGPSREVNLQRRLGRRGLFSASIEALTPGRYEAQLVRPDRVGPSESLRFEVRQPIRELAQVAVNRQELSAAADLSGGKFYTIEDAANLSDQLPPPRQQTLDEVPPRSLWNHNFVVALFVVLVTSEWILRRRAGML